MVIILDNNRPELWKGGPWEQPSRPVATLPHIPAPRRPVLRVKKTRRRSPLIGVLCAVIVALVVLVAVLIGQVWGLWHFDAPQFYGLPDFPMEYYDPYAGEYDDALSTALPPTIPAAPTGTGVTVELVPDGGQPLTYEEIYRRCAPSIVSISAQTPHAIHAGTGIVLTRDGYILTNAHIVAGADYVEVVTHDNRFAAAALVGFAAGDDLAVLKVELTGLTPAVFGDSDDLNIGEDVAAIGDSLGYRSTMTEGIISALDREVELEGVTLTLIQNSAAINSGSSGGALVDRYGHVIGLTTAKIVSGDGSSEAMCFAIPSVRLKYAADRLIAGEEVVRGMLGITVSTRPVDGPGLEVLEVAPESDACAQGIRPGDIILRANGVDILSAQTLTRLKLTLGAGDRLALTVRRGEEIFDVAIVLAPA